MQSSNGWFELPGIDYWRDINDGVACNSASRKLTTSSELSAVAPSLWTTRTIRVCLVLVIGPNWWQSWRMFVITHITQAQLRNAMQSVIVIVVGFVSNCLFELWRLVFEFGQQEPESEHHLAIVWICHWVKLIGIGHGRCCCCCRWDCENLSWNSNSNHRRVTRLDGSGIGIRWTQRN